MSPFNTPGEHAPEMPVQTDGSCTLSPTAQGTAAGYFYLFASHDSSNWDILLQSQGFKYLKPSHDSLEI